ncbi:MAG: helix-turn-helix domain-containing protein, partial [Chloroflexota bacterium]
IAMYLCRDLTEHSLPQIGEAFGGRSHTTVLHGINKIEESLEFDGILEKRIHKIRKDILGITGD